jgi:hypothetical protein
MIEPSNVTDFILADIWPYTSENQEKTFEGIQI